MKYKLTDETMTTECGVLLHRIECVCSFGNVKAGDKGGWVQNENNLSKNGNAWVFDNARVYDKAQVCGDARVYEKARVYGDARVFDNAQVCGDALIGNSNDYIVFKNNWSSGRWFTWTRSNDMWKVGCFYGTGKDLIEKAYNDSKISGDCYKAYVELVDKLKEIFEKEQQKQ